jgi:hypothetical protein
MTMLNIIKGLFGIAKDSKSILKDIGTQRQKSKGIANKILAETEFNIELILVHYHRNKVPAEKIIPRLKIESLSEALDGGFDFTALKKGKVSPTLAGESPFMTKYIDHDCEQLYKKIRKHIEAIQLLPELYNLSEERGINTKTRLENLGKRYLLLVKFLKE